MEIIGVHADKFAGIAIAVCCSCSSAASDIG